MSHRHPLAVVAGSATIMAAIPLSTVFASFTWLVYAILAVGLIAATAMGVRSLRGPVWAQVLAMMATLLLFLTFIFPSGAEYFRLIPSAGTLRYFNDLFAASGQQIREQAIPVQDLDGLLLLTTAGVGLVAIMVDFLAVGIRRPALAGLPMLAIYSVPVAVLPGGLPIFPFVFAAAGYLWLLVADSVDRVRRFGRRFTGDGRDVDVWEPSPLSAAGRRLGVVGVVVAMLVPLAVPGMTSGLLDNFGSRSGSGPGTGSGIGPSSVDLFALLNGNLTQDRVVDMVTVTTNDPSPYYLRFAVADQVTRDGFTNRPPSSTLSVTRGLPQDPIPSIGGVTSQPYQARIEVIDLDLKFAPVYHQLVRAQGLNNAWYFDQSTNEVFSQRASVDNQAYTIDFVRIGYTPNALRQATSATGDDAPTRALTVVPQIKEISDLVTELTAGKTTQYDRVRALYDHFSPSNGFTYTTKTEEGDSDNAIVDFLQNKRGFCVQYAAALAWLTRAAGYPARVAFGFTRGRSTSSGVYTLTNLNLHAWTEVLFPGFGWVPFDATPSSAIVGSVMTAWSPDTTLPPDPDELGEGEVDPTDKPSAPVIDDNETDPVGPDVSAPTSTAISPGWVIGFAAIVALGAALALPALGRRAMRRRRRSRSGDLIVLAASRSAVAGTAADPRSDLVLDGAAMALARRDAHEAWAELIDTMVDFEVPIDDAETPRSTGERLSTLLSYEPSTKTQTALLARAEERARYASIPLRPHGLDEAVGAIRSTLAERATRRQRILATVMPKSVTLRWRAAWVTSLTRVVSATGLVRERLLAVSPRRLLSRQKARAS